MARIVVDASSGMVVGVIEEHFKGGAVMDVGAWMELEPERAAAVAGIVEERPPAAGEFLEGLHRSDPAAAAARGRSCARQIRRRRRERCACRSPQAGWMKPATPAWRGGSRAPGPR